jgi:glycyl-tRNA synthetase alpha subunit
LEHCLKCSHLFNLLDSSGSVGVTERMAYILRVRQLALAICRRYVEEQPGTVSREPAAGPSTGSGPPRAESRGGS